MCSTFLWFFFNTAGVVMLGYLQVQSMGRGCGNGWHLQVQSMVRGCGNGWHLQVQSMGRGCGNGWLSTSTEHG